MPTFTSLGIDFDIVNYSLTTEDTVIVIDQTVNSVVIQARTSVDLQIRRSTADADFFTLKSGSSISMDIFKKLQGISTNVVAIRTSSGITTLEIIYIR